jgi:hypothetical protein
MSNPKKAPTPGGVDFPFSWEDIVSKLGLISTKEIPQIVLYADFFNPWILFRDEMPLRPGTAVLTVAPKDKEAMNESVVRIYDLMDNMSYCKYDRPTRDERRIWDVKEWLECLVYQIARNLARDGHTFAVPFQRTNLKNEPGRREAFHRLRGLIMLISNLCVNYTLMAPSNLIKKIEAVRPAKDPNLSPIAQVRVKWQLSNMGIDELRKKVLDCERKGKEEKEWLIGILMGKEVAPRATDVGTGIGVLPETSVKKEGSVEVSGTKRANHGLGEEEGVTKRAKTVV